MRNKVMEFMVGLFILAGLLGLLLLAVKVSGITMIGSKDYYVVTAEFDNIGDLKVRAPVTVSGVVVGRVRSIVLDSHTFQAVVKMKINHQFNQFPKDTSASILTEGLLGSNYISLTPGFEQAALQQGSVIETTHSALVLENIVGQLMFNLKNDDTKTKQEKQ